MDFVTSLSIPANQKGDSYDLILVIVDQLTKMVYYKPVKVMIDVPDLAEVIIDIVVNYHKVPISIVMNWGLLFISKFWSLLCYFLGIKKQLFTAFHFQANV